MTQISFKEKLKQKAQNQREVLNIERYQDYLENIVEEQCEGNLIDSYTVYIENLLEEGFSTEGFCNWLTKENLSYNKKVKQIIIQL